MKCTQRSIVFFKNTLSTIIIGKHSFISVSVTKVNESPKESKATYYLENPFCKNLRKVKEVKENYHNRMSCLMKNGCWLNT